MTWAWGLAAIVALLWPARTAGPLDGLPLEGVAEAVLIGVVFPALLWWHPRFLRTRAARGAIVTLIVWKALGAVALVPDGWCVRFEPGRPYVADATSPVPHSWDVRADWLAPQPSCSAVMRRRYMGLGEFQPGVPARTSLMQGLASATMVLSLNDPAQFDWLALPLFAGAAAALLAVAGAPRFRDLSAPLTLSFVVTMAAAFVARGSAYSGFSVHVIGICRALTVCGAVRLIRPARPSRYPDA